MTSRINRKILSPGKYPGSLFIAVLLLLLFSCSPVHETIDHNITAVWDVETSTLNISGHDPDNRAYVEIHDSGTMELLGAAVVDDENNWQASASTPACEIHVTLSKGVAVVPVQNAPANCSANALTGRVAEENAIPVNVQSDENPNALSNAPNAIILSPPSNITISAGQAVNFAGTATGGSITPPLGFYWNFGGAAANTSVQNPGQVYFYQPGVYFVQLTATDSLGIPDPTPAVRTITVTENSNSPVATTPIPVITSPASNNGVVSVNIGQSLYFTGTASDTTGSTTFYYEWNFAGAAPPYYGPTPGNITFYNAGTYRVTLYATNVIGTRSVTPDTLTVIVGGIGGVGGNQAPDGAIVSPPQDVTVNLGDTLNFRARGFDPDNSQPLYYSWEFNGVSPDIYMSQSPNAGNITFNTPGVYYIKMTVSDAQGIADPTPAVRRITVQYFGGGGGGTNGTLSGQIVSPPTDVTISPGQSVFFSAQSFSGVPGQLRFLWTFDGAAPNSFLQTPGDISFPTPGQFIVQMQVADQNGNILGPPDTRTINVTGSGGGTSLIIADITSPTANSTAQVGEPIYLAGQANSTANLIDIQYKWRVSLQGSTTDVFTSNQLIGGNFIPTVPGTYRIRFRVSGLDTLSNTRVSTVVRRDITVGSPFINSTPIIASPAQDMFVSVGQTVYFQAGNVPGLNVSYRWNFGSVAPISLQANPPPVTFNQPGSYVVQLRVRGTAFTGAPLDITEQRIITVSFGGGIPPFPGPVPGPIPGPFPGPFPGPIPQPPVTGAAAPEGIIDQPATNLTVRVGTPVSFTGRGFDPLGGGQLSFIWSFGGAAPNIVSQYPGTVTFNRVGNFVVSLLVVNSRGQIDPTPDTVVITVTP
ncbi:MAG: PKD domain-containing protein [Gammaproteobacteria bacterium]|nr:PKD domain-containing protein [Gammaproteobacteria bacterium]